MALIGIERRLTMWQCFCQKMGRSRRQSCFLFSMPQEHLLERYLLNLEAPGLALGKYDLHVPSRSLPEAFGHRLGKWPSHLWIAQDLLICSSKPCCVPSEKLLDAGRIGAG